MTRRNHWRCPYCGFEHAIRRGEGQLVAATCWGCKRFVRFRHADQPKDEEREEIWHESDTI